MGTVTIGQATSGGGATGTVDFSGQASLTASLSHLTVGSAGTGSLLLPNTNTIDTQSLVVGDTNGNGTLRLGTQNSLLADTMQVGNSYANASVTMPAGGTLSLGSPTRPTDLSVGNVLINTNSSYTATVDLSGATVNADFNNFTVGQKTASLPGNELATFVGGRRRNNQYWHNRKYGQYDRRQQCFGNRGHQWPGRAERQRESTALCRRGQRDA